MKNIKLYSSRNLLMMVIVIMTIISTVSYSLSSLANVNEKVTQDITDFSRGTYDIILRPVGAQTNIEEQLGLIEENYLGTGDGGITIEQWKEIKSHPLVEIAAPVASIGLFTARERTWMLEKNEQEAMYYEVEYRTSDGISKYVNTEISYIYDFGNAIREFMIYPSSFDVGDNYLGLDIASFKFPKTYHQVVAVNPEEEGKLTGYDFNPLSEQVFDHDAYKEGGLSIPIMSLKDVSVPVTIQLTMDNLENVSEEELMTWESEFMDGSPSLTLYRNPAEYFRILEDYISKKREQQQKIYKFVPDTGHSPFKQALLHIDDNMKLSSDGDMFTVGGTFDYHSQRVGYKLEPIEYEVKSDKTLFVKQIGVDDSYGAPIYRDIEQIEFYEVDESNNPLNEKDFIGFVENGTFSIEENADSLASAPLGIYGREMPYLATNPSIKLHPSAIPGSFITTPAHGLVSMEWAEKMKGNAPIDAIRVKVAGITGYDEKAASLIRKLADEWSENGFTVDIVAGASLQDLIVEVEGIGDVVQSFTTLGAADTVLSSWNALQFTITVLYGLVAFTFIGFTFFNLIADRRRDELLLGKLGWSNKLINRLRYREWSTMIAIPIIIVMIGFTLLGMLSEQWLPLKLSIIVSGSCVCLLFLSYLFQSIRPRQHNKVGNIITIQNIWFYRFKLLAACVQIFFVTILTCFLPFFLFQNVGRTTETRLGSYVHGEIEGLLIVITILLYVLSLTTVYQSLNRMWKQREPELRLFFYLGWETKVIRNYFLKETFFWSGLSILIGWGVSLSITFVLIEVTAITMFCGILGLILILVLTLGISIYSLHQVKIKGGNKYGYQAS